MRLLADSKYTRSAQNEGLGASVHVLLSPNAGSRSPNVGFGQAIGLKRDGQLQLQFDIVFSREHRRKHRGHLRMHSLKHCFAFRQEGVCERAWKGA